MAPRKLPKDALLTEILQKVSSAKTKKEKIEATIELRKSKARVQAVA